MALADRRDPALAGIRRQEVYSGVLADPGSVQYGTLTKDDTTTVTSITPGLPSDIVAGDILTAVVISYGRSTVGAAPAGYTLDSSTTNGGTNGTNGTAIVVACYTKTAVGGDTAPALTVLTSGRGAKAFMSRFRPKGTGSINSSATYPNALVASTSQNPSGAGNPNDAQGLFRTHRFAVWVNGTATLAPAALTGRVSLPALGSLTGAGVQSQDSTQVLADDVSTPAGSGAIGAVGSVVEFYVSTNATGQWTWGTAQIAGNVNIEYKDSAYTAPASVAVTPGVAQNKGAWVELFSSANFDARQLILDILAFSGTNSSSYYTTLDVAIGASGSEQVLLSDVGLMHEPGISDGAASQNHPHRLVVPVRIPAGSRVAVRAYQRPALNVAQTGQTLTIFPDLVD